MNRKWCKEVGACSLNYDFKFPDRTRQIRAVGFAFSRVFGVFLFLFVIGFVMGVDSHGAYAKPGVQEGSSCDGSPGVKAPLKAENYSAEGQQEGGTAIDAEEKEKEKEKEKKNELKDEEGDEGGEGDDVGEDDDAGESDDPGEGKGDTGSTLKENEKTPARGDSKESVAATSSVEAKEKPRPRATEQRADEMPRPVGRVKESQGEDSKVQGGSLGEKPDVKGEEQKKSKGYEPAGDTAVVGGIGLQYGLTDDSVGGFKLGLSYGYRLTDWMWFDAQANFTFGGNCIGEEPAEGEPKEYACNNVRGFGIEAVAGVQWKFYGIEKWQAPVVPFVRAGLGVVAIITNGPNDGLALVARGSGGVRYHFFPWFAVGGELGVALGPAFRNHLDTGFFAALDLMAGAEFHF